MTDAEGDRRDKRAELAELLERVPEAVRVDADEAIRRADDADELVERLRTLLESRERGGTNLDGAVADAESVEELRGAVDAPGEVSDRGGALDPAGAPDRGDPGRSDPGPAGPSGPVDRIRSTVGSLRERLPTRSGTDGPADGERAAAGEGSATVGGESPVVRARRKAGDGLGDVRQTLRDADPSEAALWGLCVGGALANPAVAAGYSTYVLLGGAVVGGSALGAYKSSHEGTILDDLDPTELVRRTNATAAAGRDLEGVDGETLGAALGASTYLAERLAPEAYAHWVTEADPASVVEGAGYGAAYADRLGGHRQGVALGSGIGLLYGYAADDLGDGDAMRELLDEDLYREFLRERDAGG